MTLQALIAEGERLARPCLFLAEAANPAGVVAYWRGNGRVGYRGRDGDRHRITFDCGWLSQHGVRVRGSVGVYDVDGRWRWPVPLHLDRLEAPLAELRIDGGTPLYGQEDRSFTPFPALCLYGGPAVGKWLAAEGLDRTDYDIAETTEIGEAYQEEYRNRSPLYLADQPAAVLGGWHASWPDDEFYLPREMRLALWTFREAEPWVEVFERSPNMPVRLRIT
jgi:hypothetical protein